MPLSLGDQSPGFLAFAALAFGDEALVDRYRRVFYEDAARLVSHSAAFTMPERPWLCGVDDVLYAMKDSGDSDMPPATLRWAGPVLGE